MKKKIVVALLVIAVLALISVSPRRAGAEITPSRLRVACESTEASDRLFCAGFLSGSAHALAEIQILTCASRTTVEAVRLAFLKSTAATPQVMSADVTTAISFSLINEGLCKLSDAVKNTPAPGRY